MDATTADDTPADPPAGLPTSNTTATGEDERGASLVEYALLVSMIALVAIAAVVLLGGATAGQISSAASLFPD